MPPRTTRNTAARGAATTASPAAAASRYVLAPASDSPPQLFILPTQATAAARIVTLPHPRQAGAPTRFLVCPETGVYEFTRIACPPMEPRSWLVAGERPAAAATTTSAEDSTGEDDPTEQTDDSTGKNSSKTADKASQEEASPSSSGPPFEPHTIENADLFVATVVDPLFLLLPALADTAATTAAAASSSPPPKRMFLAADDHFDALPTAVSHLADLLRDDGSGGNAIRARFTARMAAVCDTVAAGDEPMYRLNEDKLLLALLGKARRVSGRLPSSMVSTFVTAPLQAPVLGVKRVATTSTTTTGGASPASASAATTAASTPVSTTTAATTVDTDDDRDCAAAMQASDEVVALQRLRVAFDFVCARYVPRALAAALQARLLSASGGGGIDFKPLDTYTKRLTQMRQEAAAARSAVIEYGQKRGLEVDDYEGDADARAEKRRKQEEEERRKKAGESRGVRNLKKVNVSGMRKMSDFFKKA